MWKYNNLISSKEHSLAKQYLYFTMAVISMILVIILWTSFSTYHSYRENKLLFLEREGHKLVSDFDEKITYIEHLLKFLGNKVTHMKHVNDAKIVDLINHHTDNFHEDIFSWHALYFTNPEGILIADSVNGVIPVQKILTEKRSWVEKAYNKPWTLFFAKPDIGMISRDYIVSSAMGMRDNKTLNFFGYLSAGISIEKLTSRLLRTTGDEISFVIIDKENNFITSSEPSLTEENFNLQSTTPNDFLKFPRSHTNKMDKPIEAENFIFTHMFSSAKFPFLIFIGQNKHFYYQELKEDLLPRIILYVSLGIIFTGILLFLGYQVIKPIIELGMAADNISHNKKANIPQYHAKELSVLADQLSNINNITTNLRVKQQEITTKNQELATANEFIKSNMSFLSHELINPISTIIGFADILKGKASNFKDNEVKTAVKYISKAAVHQEKQLKFFLNLFKFQGQQKELEEKEINLSELIEWNVSMVTHHAKKKNLRFHINVQKGMNIIGDEIMLGQLIQNLASNAAKYNKENGEIFIDAHTTKSGKIIIDFKDTGIGIAKKDLEKIFKNFTRIENSATVTTLGYGIGLPYSKKCAIVHGGKITVTSTLGSGSRFRVTLPAFRLITKTKKV